MFPHVAALFGLFQYSHRVLISAETIIINSQCRTLLADQNKIHENLKALIKSMFLHHPAKYETVPVSIASYFSRRINNVYNFKPLYQNNKV